MLRLADPSQVLFASDMHLDDRHPALTTRFLADLSAHLQRLPAPETTLFLLGDLFEYWIGDDAVGPSAQKLAEVLHAFGQAGGTTFLMHGNRDFLLDAPLPGQPDHPRYSQRCGATLLPDPTVVEIGGQRVLLSHGDLLCTDDVPYQQWRQQCRQPAWQAQLLARTVPERIALAQSLRTQSHEAQQGTLLVDVNPQAVDDMMDAHDCALLVHGHTHRPALHRWLHQGTERTRWVLSDWSEQAPPQGRGTVMSFAEGMALPPVP